MNQFALSWSRAERIRELVARVMPAETGRTFLLRSRAEQVQVVCARLRFGESDAAWWEMWKHLVGADAWGE